MIKNPLKIHSNIEFLLRNSEIILVAIKQAILPRKEKKNTFVFKYQNVNCKTHSKTSIEVKN